ncbi:MAG: sigma-70 family RNA polymerase sigma factor [Polyangiaceae bacterium]
MNARDRGSASPPEFDAIFAQQSVFVWRVLARLGVQTRDVPDACQEVFLVVHQRLADFDASRGSLRSWVYGICARVASDYRRRHPNRNESSGEVLEEMGVSGQQEEDLQAARAWRRLAQVLDRMDAAKREVFVLFELEALPMAEVALSLACPVQTAYARLHAARRLVLAAFREPEQP